VQSYTTEYNNDEKEKKISCPHCGGKSSVASLVAKVFSRALTVISVFKEGHRINETKIKGLRGIY